jgi:hypothetical protein
MHSRQTRHQSWWTPRHHDGGCRVCPSFPQGAQQRAVWQWRAVRQRLGTLWRLVHAPDMLVSGLDTAHPG